MSDSSPPTSSLPFGIHLTFTQGFLAGQLSVVILALIAIRYIIFEDSKGISSDVSRTKRGRSRSASAVWPVRSCRDPEGISATKSLFGGGMGSTSFDSHLRKGVGVGVAGLGRGAEMNNEADIDKVMADIMARTSYDVSSHGSESVDWVNVIIAQALAGYRDDVLAGGWAPQEAGSSFADPSSGLQLGDVGHNTASSRPQRSARDLMEEVLNKRTVGRGMSFLDPIQVTDAKFGESYPLFSNTRVRPADASGRMRVEVDVDYSDCISLAIETKLLINFPRPRFAVLPISMGLIVERFSGTIALELFSTSPSSVLPQSSLSPPPRSRHQLHLSLHPDFELDARATSLVGSRAKLQDVPKIEQLLVSRLRAWVHDKFVWPRYWSLTLPNLVPRTDGEEQSGQDEVSTDFDDEDTLAGQMRADEGNEILEGRGNMPGQDGFDQVEEDYPAAGMIGGLSRGLTSQSLRQASGATTQSQYGAGLGVNGTKMTQPYQRSGNLSSRPGLAQPNHPSRDRLRQSPAYARTNSSLSRQTLL